MNPYGRLTIKPTADLATVEWLLDSGEDLDRIAARIGSTPGAILKAARVAELPGLLAKVQHGWGRLS